MAEVLHTPDVILHNILARLPTKPLLRFKSVSKHWNRLISDPYFMKLRSRRMILLSDSPLHAIDDSIPAHDKAHSMIKLHCPFQNPNVNEVIIVGTFDGIVLLVLKTDLEETRMILYNLFTGTSNIVPHPPLRSSNSSIYGYGFGFGATPDDLKIVKLRAKRRQLTCDVFSLKKSSWSTTRALTGRFHFWKDVGIFVNGFLYCIVLDDNTPILVLNVKEMVFSKIHLPIGRCYLSVHLGALNGCLCMICPCDGVQFELWVMKEDKWWKACSLTLFSEGNNCNSFHPISILESGEILMVINMSNQLVIYDPLKDSHKKLPALSSFRSNLWTSCVIEYVESSTTPLDLCSGLLSL